MTKSTKSNLGPVHIIAGLMIMIAGIPFVTQAADEVSQTLTPTQAKLAPRPLNYNLFNVEQFRKLRRQSHIYDASDSPSSLAPVPAATAPVDPCNKPDHAAADSSSAAPQELHFDDLSVGQQETLTLQLRGSACPQKDETYGKPVDPDAEAYRALCDKMLRKQLREGIKRGGPRNSVSGYLNTK